MLSLIEIILARTDHTPTSKFDITSILQGNDLGESVADSGNSFGEEIEEWSSVSWGGMMRRYLQRLLLDFSGFI